MLLRSLNLKFVLVFFVCSTAHAVDLNIISPTATECVPSQRAMATGVAGQEVDIVRSNVELNLEITNWEFFYL